MPCLGRSGQRLGYSGWRQQSPFLGKALPLAADRVGSVRYSRIRERIESPKQAVLVRESKTSHLF
jgi:hypothetical protein